MSCYKKYDLRHLVEESKKDPNVITIEATVVTGFESAAMDECKEKCKPLLICRAQGRIVFNILATDFPEVLKLRAVDNLFFVNDALGDIGLTSDKEKDLDLIKSLVHQVNWKESLSSWADLMKFEGVLYPNESESTIRSKEGTKTILIEKNIDSPVENQEILASTDTNVSFLHENKMNEHTTLCSNVSNIDEVIESKTEKVQPPRELHLNKERKPKNSVSSNDSYYSAEEEDHSGETCLIDKLSVDLNQVKIMGNDDKDKTNNESNILKFRATCNRVGEHSFTSMEAAACFGGALQDKFNWTVNLTNFDLNVILNINSNNCYICSAITEKSLHRRNITHFGYTTLRATLCYNMVRMAEPTIGEIILDPLCGGGSIPIEGALGFPYTFHICGDNNDKAIKRTKANISHINKNQQHLMVDCLQWSARRLPLKDSSIDVSVTDLPFGKRSGKKSDNLPLYRDVLKELGRVSRCGTARAVLLTHDKKSLTKALSGSNNVYWRQIRTVGVNQGGLFSTVFLLLRTALPFVA